MTFKGHAKAIRAVAASPDMSTAVSASDDGTLMLWDTQTGLDSGVLAGRRRTRARVLLLDRRPSRALGGERSRGADLGYHRNRRRRATGRHARAHRACHRPRVRAGRRLRVSLRGSNLCPLGRRRRLRTRRVSRTRRRAHLRRALWGRRRVGRAHHGRGLHRARVGRAGFSERGDSRASLVGSAGRTARRVPGRARGGRCARATVCTSSTLGRGGRWRTFRDSPR